MYGKTLLKQLKDGDKDVSSLDTPLREGMALRDYQKVAVAALLSHKSIILYDQMGFGKTLESFSPYVLMKQKNPALKFVYATVKSGIYQAEEEFNRFFDGFETVVVKSDGWTKARRLQCYREAKHDCYFLSHRLLVLDAEHIAKNLTPFILVLDEANYFKGLDSQAHRIILILRGLAEATWLLTADPIENTIKDAYGLVDIVDRNLYGDFNQFKQEFCILKKVRIPKPAKWKSPGFIDIDTVVGYHNKNEFKRRFDLVSIGRTRKDVENELPDLTVKNIILELPKRDKKIYDQIEDGLFSNLTGYTKLKDHISEETTALENMIRCQQILGCPQEVYDILVKNQKNVKKDSRMLTAKRVAKLQEDAVASKEEYAVSEYDFNFASNWDSRFTHLIGLLKDYTLNSTVKCDEIIRLLSTELGEERVIIFSSYLRVIDYLGPRLKEFNPLRITGAEDAKTRNENRKLFTSSPDHKLLLVTTAALRALNLQAASCIICHDAPVTWGKLRQLVGRIIRIGSAHEMVNLVTLLVKDTIDKRVHDKLYKTQSDVELILGDLDKDKVVTMDMVTK